MGRPQRERERRSVGRKILKRVRVVVGVENLRSGTPERHRAGISYDVGIGKAQCPGDEVSSAGKLVRPEVLKHLGDVHRAAV